MSATPEPHAPPYRLALAWALLVGGIGSFWCCRPWLPPTAFAYGQVAALMLSWKAASLLCLPPGEWPRLTPPRLLAYCLFPGMQPRQFLRGERLATSARRSRSRRAASELRPPSPILSTRVSVASRAVRGLVYDAQCEGIRADWQMSMIDLAGDADFYHQRILAALPEATEFWDVAQLLRLALEFARRGCPRARAAIYEAFDQQQFREEWLGGEPIVALDGIAGLLHVAEVVGARLLADPDAWVDDSLLSQACEQCGEEPMMAALHDRAQGSPAVRAYLDSITATKERSRAAASSRTPRNVEKILADIEAPAGPPRGPFLTFGRTASEDDLGRVFERLLEETSREQLLRCLWVFRWRAFPRLDDRLLALAEGADEEVQEATVNALSQLRDGSIRELALGLLRDDSAAVTRGAIRLFERNYAPGNHAVIEASLFISEDHEVTHGLGFDVLDVGESQPDPELAACAAAVVSGAAMTVKRTTRATSSLLPRGRPDNIRRGQVVSLVTCHLPPGCRQEVPRWRGRTGCASRSTSTASRTSAGCPTAGSSWPTSPGRS